MKTIKYSLVSCILLFVFIVSSALCSYAFADDTASVLTGKWAYIYDKEQVALSFSGSKAVLDGVKYSCSFEDGFIMLTRKKITTPFRYTLSDDGTEMYLYKPTVYTYTGDGEPDGLIGKWVNEDENWSFEFSEDGHFNEDGYFPGNFADSAEEGTFKLMYTDHFEDTVCYYRIEGTELTVEYPWPMIKIDK